MSSSLGRSILVTGGTGSFGRTLVRVLLERHPGVERIVVFSRDELKQYEMQTDPWAKSERLRFFLGDVRDGPRLNQAFEDIDTVVHTAALKQVPAAEYNPFEAIKTNVLGSQNVIEAALSRGVKRVVALSTDKAAAPVNLYGATKLCADKLFVAANNFKGRRDLRFSVVRYGNVLGSRGSVVPLFLRQRQSGVISLTHAGMTRFNITLRDGVSLVLRALEQMRGGEIFVPKIPSFKVVDLALAVAPSARHDVVGIRPGEKLHEDLITDADSLYTLDAGDHYLILPALSPDRLSEAEESRRAARCPPGFRYSSDTNTAWLGVEDLRRLIRDHIDPNFEPV